jgi:hypothetical protein
MNKSFDDQILKEFDIEELEDRLEISTDFWAYKTIVAPGVSILYWWECLCPEPWD